MNELHFKVEKTARVFTLGEINEKTKEIILVFHGYAMLANYFLKNFENIANDNRVIIAPEGLSKFYWNGMGGKVRASWMTSEDRENEIIDYVNYIDKVMYTFLNEINCKIKISVLGFSQGAATATRWVVSSNINVNRLILWAGKFPRECKSNYFAKYRNQTIEFVIGNEDEYIKEDIIVKEQDYLLKNDFNYNFKSYKGNHKIDIPTLNNIFK